MSYFPLALLIGRILYGGFFVMSGYNHFKNVGMLAGYAGSKGVPSPKLAVLASGALIIAGGLGVMTGRFIIYSLWAIIIFLIPVTFMMHQFWKVSDPNMKMMETVNFKKNLALLGAALMLMSLATPWAYTF